MGVSIVFSLGRLVESEGRSAALMRVLRRTVLLYLLALVYSGGFQQEWPHIRLLGVLNRIALCYGAAALAFSFLRLRGLVMLCAGLLVGYWALLAFVPFPDVRPTPGGELVICKETGFTNVAQLRLDSPERLHGVYLKGVNLANYVDQRYLPGYKWDGTWDPEGLLSTLPAIATALLGVLAGLLLRSSAVPDARKVLALAGAGVLLLALGWLWSFQFPVIKKIWTSSYVLVAGGWSALLLAGFYLVVDVWRLRRWCQPFIWIGMNSITAYMAANLVGLGSLARRFAGGDLANALNRMAAPGAGDLVLSLVEITLVLLFVRFLYKRQIFLRL
jgi:predicted acyltransferase